MSDRDAVPAGRTLALFSVPPTPGPALQGPLTSCSVLCSAAPWRCPRSRGLQSGPAPGPPPSCTRSADALIPDSLAACHLHDQTDTV